MTKTAQISVHDHIAHYGIKFPAPALPYADGHGEDAQTLIYAASEEPFAIVPHAGDTEVEAAATKAREAFETGPWRKMLPSERHQYAQHQRSDP